LWDNDIEQEGKQSCVVILSYDKRGDREMHFVIDLKNSNYV